MTTQCEVIIEAFNALDRVRTIEEIENWVNKTYGAKWKDFGTSIADRVPQSKGGNELSLVPDYFLVLERVERGKYRLVDIY